MNTSNNKSIDFIPDEVLHKRREKAQYKELSTGGIAFLTIVVIIAISLYVYQLVLNKEIDAVNKEISTQVKEIDSMKNVAEAGYTLGVRLTTIETLLNNRVVYSKLMNEIKDKTPSSIALGEISLSDSNKLVLTGTSDSTDYSPIANFKKKLSESELFNNIKVLSASGDSKQISFSISIVLNIEKLREGTLNKAEESVLESSSENSLKTDL